MSLLAGSSFGTENSSSSLFKLISTTDLQGSSIVDITTGFEKYENYHLYLNGITTSQDSSLRMNIFRNRAIQESGYLFYDHSGNLKQYDYFVLDGTRTSESTGGLLQLCNLKSTNFAITCNTSFDAIEYGYQTSLGNITGLRFFTSALDRSFTAGKIHLYGIKTPQD